jgi:hypothetical protein
MSDEGEIDKDDDFVLFNLIGIQVSYPRVFRLFNQFPKYLDWNERPRARKFNLPSVEARVYGPLVVSVVLG